MNRADRAVRDLVEAVYAALADGVTPQRVLAVAYASLPVAARRQLAAWTPGRAPDPVPGIAATSDVMRLDAIDHLRVTAQLARQAGAEPADILEAAYAAVPEVIREERERSAPPSGLHLRTGGDAESGPEASVYFGDAWVCTVATWPSDGPLSGSQGVAAQRRAFDAYVADKLRPLFDGSVVTR